MFKKIFKKLFILGLVLIPGLAFAALENIYPPITIFPGITFTIDANSSTSDYVLYFYTLLVGLGVVVTAITIIMAGVKLIMSEGSPGKFSEAKKQTRGAIIGLAILLASYLILNAITKDSTKINLNALKCDESEVCVETWKKDPDGNIQIKYSGSLFDSDNLMLEDGEKIIIKKYKGLKEIWGFSDVNYEGTPELIQMYRDDDMSNLNNDLLSEITINDNIKSIKIYNKQYGLYLYDNVNFTISELPPLFINRSIANLGEYKDKIKSVKIFNQNDNSYYAIIFAFNDYNNGYDYNFYPRLPSSACSDVIIEDEDSFTGTANSILLFKSSEDFLSKATNPGITFYNTLNCYIKEGSDPLHIDKCLLPETLPLSSPFAVKNISSACSIWFGNVLSIQLAKQYGVLVIADKAGSGYDYCKFFDISDPNKTSGDCVSDDIFFKKIDTNNPYNGGNTNKYIVVPYETKL